MMTADMIDLFVFVATLAAIVDRRRGRPTTYAWTLAGLYSAATAVTSARPDHLAEAVHAIPAVTTGPRLVSVVRVRE